MKKVLFILVVMFLISCGGEDARRIKMIPDEISDEDIVEDVVDSQVDEVQDKEDFSDIESVDDTDNVEIPDEEDEYDQKYFDPDYEPDCGDNELELDGSQEEYVLINELNCEDMKPFTSITMGGIRVTKASMLECIPNLKCVGKIKIEIENYSGNIDLSRIEEVSHLSVYLVNSKIKKFSHPKRISKLSYIVDKDDDQGISEISNMRFGYVDKEATVQMEVKLNSELVLDRLFQIYVFSICNTKGVLLPNLHSVSKGISFENVDYIDVSSLVNTESFYYSGSNIKEIYFTNAVNIKILTISNNPELEYIYFSQDYSPNGSTITVVNNPKLDAHYIFDKACMDADCTMEGNLGD